MKDYYKILEIHPDASLEVMNNAYRALVRKYHPDLYHTTHKNLMDERMQEINEAYNVLSNAASRAQYDRKYRNRQPDLAKRPTSAVGNMRNMLIWGIGTFVVMKFLLRPLLSSPVLAALVLVLVIYLFLRYYGQRKTPE